MQSPNLVSVKSKAEQPPRFRYAEFLPKRRGPVGQKIKNSTPISKLIHGKILLAGSVFLPSPRTPGP